MAPISDVDMDRIAEAVRRAEAKTSGEIVCVMTEEASRYRETPLMWGIAAALALPPAALALGAGALAAQFDPVAWSAAHASALEGQVAFALTVYAVVQAALFLAVAGFVSIPRVRRVLTPTQLKRHRVAEMAHQQFAAAGLAQLENQACVLIFISRLDRQVQVLAGGGIHAAAGQGTWDAAAAAVRAGMQRGDATGGIVAAVEQCGEALAAHFPFDGEDPNRFGDRPVQI